jgi:hypothetical protein
MQPESLKVVSGRTVMIKKEFFEKWQTQIIHWEWWSILPVPPGILCVVAPVEVKRKMPSQREVKKR